MNRCMVIAVLALAAGTAAGQIKYRLNNSLAQDLPADRVIDVDHISGPNNLHIFDDDPATLDSVGQIVLRGSAANSIDTILRVRIVDRFDTDGAFEFPASTFRQPGIGDCGGLRCEHPSDPEDKSLRYKTAVIVSNVGDITGNVEVGLVYRVDCLRRPDTSGGRILGNIHTLSFGQRPLVYGTGVPNPQSIEYVRAGHEIAGTVEAEGVPNTGAENGLHIEKVVVGPSLSAAGITGDIKADLGHITSIYTTGPIGTTSRASIIRAGVYVTEVRAIAESAPTAPLDRDLHVALDSRWGDLYSTLLASLDGALLHKVGGLSLVETAGDVKGSIRAANLCYRLDGVRAGILAGGKISTPITLDISMYRADIVAQSIEAPIEIGIMAKGSVVATDDEAGWIESIDIGYQTPGSQGDVDFYADYLPSGFVGNDCWPMPPRGGTHWYGRNDAPGRGCGPFGSLDGGAVDSVIRARAIGVARIRSMTEVYSWLGGGDVERKTKRPRIEAQDIGELEIGALRAGLVWSGVDETPDSDTGNILATDFTKVQALRIGCIGGPSDLWVENFEQFDIAPDLTLPGPGPQPDGNVSGEIHVPSVSADQLVRLDGGLVKVPHPPNSSGWPSTCGCVESLLVDPFNRPCVYTNALLAATPLDQDSPRWPTYGFGELIGDNPGGLVAPRGAINVYNEEALHGQVVLDAANTTGSQRVNRWQGVVRIEGGSDPLVELSPDSAPPRQAPLYAELPAKFGGGAVGLFPYAVHQASSDAINNAGTGLLSSEWNRPVACTDQPAVLDFYGPVTLQGQEPYTGAAVGVVLANPVHDVTDHVEFTTATAVAGAPFNRHLRIFPRMNAVLPQGVYETSATGLPAGERLLCTLGATPAAAISTASFSVVLDCPEEDDWCTHTGPYDCTPDPVENCSCGVLLCDGIDFNGDGLFPDNLDLDDFMSVFGGGACSTGTCNDLDFNNDGLFPDNADMEAIFSVFSGGPCIG